MHALFAIIWDLHPEVFGFLDDSPIAVRWYGLLFATGFYLGYRLMKNIFKKEGLSEELLEKLFMYTIIATVAGARLGHVFFYGPYFTPEGTGYLDQPLSILKVWEGGLASHGAAVAILLALFWYARKFLKNHSYLWLLDRVVIVIILAGFCIRAGNLMNSEMIGKASDSGVDVVFLHETKERFKGAFNSNLEAIAFETQGASTSVKDTAFAPVQVALTFNNRQPAKAMEGYLKGTFFPYLNGLEGPNKHLVIRPETDVQINEIPTGYTITFSAFGVIRHPAQSYEAVAYLLIFILLYLAYWRWNKGEQEGFIFGTFLILTWGMRFIIEFVKANQVGVEEGLPLNMGQLLSIPLIIVGIYLLIRSQNKQQAHG